MFGTIKKLVCEFVTFLSGNKCHTINLHVFFFPFFKDKTGVICKYFAVCDNILKI